MDALQTRLAQAQILFGLKRYQDAEAALRQALACEPTHAYAHALLALALYNQDRHPEALQAAHAAIGLAPTDAFNHYVLALALLQLDQAGESLRAIQSALRLEPEDPDYHAFLSQIYIHRKEWNKAIGAAEAGLRFDAEHVQCANLRGLALTKLGRTEEAGQTIAAALARDPTSAMTHANQGWALLHSGDQQQAFVHFREALRLNPMSNWARAGIVEAMKARSLVYRLMLRYFLWLSSLTDDDQAGLFGALYGLRMTLGAIASASCLLWILFLPLEFFYQLFVALAWTARPFFALLLRFDSFGRQVLPQEEITASNWLALCLLAAGGNAIAGLVLGQPAFLVGVFVALSMIVPVAATTQCPPGGRRIFLIAYAAVLAQLGLAVLVLALIGTPLALGLAIALAIVFILIRPWFTLVTFLVMNLE